ncbi:MAG TPA: acetylxylan esterase [Gemmataceae bacterium]|nr:acetylxylan esterase [Gemmataceae bacterium]
MRAALLMTLALPPLAAAADKFPPADQLPSRLEPPDPLVTLGGVRVESAAQWDSLRKPELKELLQYYMYGYFPPPAAVTAKVVESGALCLGGKATKRVVELSFGPPRTPAIHLLLVLPAQRGGPVPVFLGLSFTPIATVLREPGAPPPEETRQGKGRGPMPDVWNVEQTIARGYGVAIFAAGELEPDDAKATTGIRRAWRKPGQTEFGPHDWGTIAAWAYGMHRAVDYLVTEPTIDKTKIIAVGHSRMGKATLLAAAFDERIAMAIPLQAGCGGTAPNRLAPGAPATKIETVKRINTSFPHWFTGAFKDFNEYPDRLPFDQNCLVALCVPRPVLYANATEDVWANPDGQFDMLKSADPVYKLLAKPPSGLETLTRPPENVLSPGTLGYFIRPGRHSMTKDDWKVFLDYADHHWGRR